MSNIVAKLRAAFEQLVESAVDPRSPLRKSMVAGIMAAHDAMLKAAIVEAAQQEEAITAKRTPVSLEAGIKAIDDASKEDWCGHIPYDSKRWAKACAAAWNLEIND